jgi:regulator of RNase E activity RraA
MSLKDYSVCDISDALTKLGLPSFISTVSQQSPLKPLATRIIGPAHTIEIQFSSSPSPRLPAEHPHHIDCAPPGSIIVIKAPSTAVNAVFGGILMTRYPYVLMRRAKVIGVKGVVAEGRIRDVSELHDAEYPVYASGRSTLGAAPHCKVTGVKGDLTMCGDSVLPVVVKAGDMIVADSDGVVCVPIGCVEEVVEMCRLAVLVDAKVLKDVQGGRTLKDSFKEHRGK